MVIWELSFRVAPCGLLPGRVDGHLTHLDQARDGQPEPFGILEEEAIQLNLFSFVILDFDLDSIIYLIINNMVKSDFRVLQGAIPK